MLDVDVLSRTGKKMVINLLFIHVTHPQVCMLANGHPMSVHNDNLSTYILQLVSWGRSAGPNESSEPRVSVGLTSLHREDIVIADGWDEKVG